MKWLVRAVFLSPFVLIAMSVAYPDYLVSKIEIGMSRNQVDGILEKEPILSVEAGDLCSRFQWYGDCEEAKNSRSVIYYLWKFGIDRYIAIGFDQGKKVSFAGAGDT